MTLEEYQKTMLRLIKSPNTFVPPHPCFEDMAQSKGLKMLHEVVLRWRSFQIQSKMPLSSRYLARVYDLDALIRAFYFKVNVSPYIEEAARQFAHYLVDLKDETLNNLIEMESQLNKIHRGTPVNARFYWQCDPVLLIQNLVKGRGIFPEGKRREYVMIIDHQLKDKWEVFPL